MKTTYFKLNLRVICIAILFACLTNFALVPVASAQDACVDAFRLPTELKPITMKARFKNEETEEGAFGYRTFHFTTPEQRAPFRWEIANGKIFSRTTGAPVTTATDRVPRPNTHDNWMNQNPSAFVISPEGRIFGFTRDQAMDAEVQVPDRWSSSGFRTLDPQHSTLLAGRPVGFAGEMKIVNGEVTEFTNRSGHYEPGDDATVAAIRFLMSKGLSFRNTKFKIMRGYPRNPEHDEFFNSLMPNSNSDY
jgi:hypothetical protein